MRSFFLFFQVFLIIIPVKSFSNHPTSCVNSFSIPFSSNKVKQKRRRELSVAKQILEEQITYQEYVKRFKQATGYGPGIARWFAKDLGFNLAVSRTEEKVFTKATPLFKVDWSSKEKAELITKIIEDAGGSLISSQLYKLFNQITEKNMRSKHISKIVHLAGFGYERDQINRKSFQITKGRGNRLSSKQHNHHPKTKKYYNLREKLEIAQQILAKKPLAREYYHQFAKITGLSEQMAHIIAKKAGYRLTKDPKNLYTILKKTNTLYLNNFDPLKEVDENILFLFLEHDVNSINYEALRKTNKHLQHLPGLSSIQTHQPFIIQDVKRIRKHTLHNLVSTFFNTNKNNKDISTILKLLIESNLQNETSYNEQTIKNPGLLQTYPNLRELDNDYNFSFLSALKVLRKQWSLIKKNREDLITIRFSNHKELVFDYPSIETELASFIERALNNKNIKILGYRNYLRNNQKIKNIIEDSEREFFENNNVIPEKKSLVNLFVRFKVNRKNYLEKKAHIPELMSRALPNSFYLITKWYPKIEYSIAFKYAFLKGKTNFLLASKLGFTTKKQINHAIKSLTPIEQKVFALKYDLNGEKEEGYLSFKEIASRLNLSTQRAHQIEREAFAKLKARRGSSSKPKVGFFKP